MSFYDPLRGIPRLHPDDSPVYPEGSFGDSDSAFYDDIDRIADVVTTEDLTSGDIGLTTEELEQTEEEELPWVDLARYVRDRG